MDRCEALLAALKEKAIDGAIVLSAPNRRYFSGFSGSNAMLFIANEQRLIITDFRYMEQVKRQCPAFEPRIVRRTEELTALANAVKDTHIDLKSCRGRACLCPETGQTQGLPLQNSCINHRMRDTIRIGYESESVSVELYTRIIEAMPKGIELVPIDGEIARLRAVKSPDELANIREAARIADAVFAELPGYLRPGITELEAAAFIEYRLKLNGADGTSFPPIVASGENAALPHAEPSQKELKAGELVVMDFGARLNGYCSDMTRTVALKHASDRQKELYALVLEAQKRALDALRPGLTGSEADAFARDVIANAGYGEQFGHGLGHGVGLEIHEAPTLGARSEDVLMPGMVVTVEPGIYVPGFAGVRIENLCAITAQGAQNFTASIKDFMIL